MEPLSSFNSTLHQMMLLRSLNKLIQHRRYLQEPCNVNTSDSYRTVSGSTASAPFSTRKSELTHSVDAILSKLSTPNVSPRKASSPSPSHLPTFSAAMSNPVVPSSMSIRQFYSNYPPNRTLTALMMPKSKRNRTVFTAVQLERLEYCFSKCNYLVGTERSKLATELRLNETQVKVWFQNRRIKHRKQSKHISSSGSPEESCDSDTDGRTKSEP